MEMGLVPQATEDSLLEVVASPMAWLPKVATSLVLLPLQALNLDKATQDYFNLGQCHNSEELGVQERAHLVREHQMVYSEEECRVRAGTTRMRTSRWI